MDQNGIRVKGILTDEEEGVFNFDVNLFHTGNGQNDSTSIWVIPGQKFYITKDKTRGMENIGGTMRVLNHSSWNNFVFNGSLFGTTGASGNIGF